MEDRVVPRSSKRITQKYKPLSHKGVDIGWSSVEENNKVHANCRGIVREVVDGKTNNIKSTGDPNLDFTKKWGASEKSPSSWFNSLSVQQKAEAKALKES